MRDMRITEPDTALPAMATQRRNAGDKQERLLMEDTGKADAAGNHVKT